VSKSDIFIRQEDFDHYEQVLQDYAAGEIDHNRLVSERLLLGVYGQRQDGLCMLRTKLPGGRLQPRQLLGYAEALETFVPGGAVHLTTRQDIQFNDIPLAQTPALARHMASHGVTCREAGGNTVRNITACPMAGVCPREHVDVTPYIDGVARYFIRSPLTQFLPRKFKITFSGCEADCAMGQIQDLGVIAVRNEGRPGFRLLVGGGLGSKPRQAVVLEPFIEAWQLLPAIQAVLVLHDKHSDRERKGRSRIKFLVEDFGEAGFIERYRAELARTSAAFDADAAPSAEWREATEGDVCGHGAPRQIAPQHQAGLHAVPIQVPGGDLDAGQLRGLAGLLERLGHDHLRVTQDQNLLVLNVREADMGPLRQGLEALNLGLPQAGGDVVACPGTATCQLGITNSRLVARLLNGGKADLSLRVNGCQNNCAHSDVADIGLYGKGRRHFGKLVPTYALRLGGSGQAGGEFAFAGPDVPAARVPAAVERVGQAYHDDCQDGEAFSTWSRRKGTAYFKGLLEDLTQVQEIELAMLQRDHGDSTVFRVHSVGVGECAGAQVDPLDKLLLEAIYERNLRDAFAAKRKFEEAGECLGSVFAITVQALLSAAGAGGAQPVRGSLSGALATALPAEDGLLRAFSDLMEAFDAWRQESDELLYPELAEQADAWLKRARRRCRQLQAARQQTAKAAQQVA
jgi:sulfite reductase beta subunit-like hemoprotein